MKYLMFSLMILLSSCSYNISMAHTEGSAADVIDDISSNTANVEVPLTPASSLKIK